MFVCNVMGWILVKPYTNCCRLDPNEICHSCSLVIIDVLEYKEFQNESGYKNNMEIIVFQEIKWKGKGIVRVEKERFDLCYTVFSKELSAELALREKKRVLKAKDISTTDNGIRFISYVYVLFFNNLFTP